LVRVLVDTSAWIEFLRRREPCYRIVGGLIDEDRIVCAGLVLGELIQGAKSEKELAVLKEFLHVFDFLPESARLWGKAGELSFSLRRKGHAIGLSDCWLAVAAKENDAAILSLDRHFGVLGRETGMTLHPLE